MGWDKQDDLPPVPPEQVASPPARYVYPPDVQAAIARYEAHLALTVALDDQREGGRDA